MTATDKNGTEIKIGDKLKFDNKLVIASKITSSGYIWIKFRNGRERLIWPYSCEIDEREK